MMLFHQQRTRMGEKNKKSKVLLPRFMFLPLAVNQYPNNPTHKAKKTFTYSLMTLHQNWAGTTTRIPDDFQITHGTNIGFVWVCRVSVKHKSFNQSIHRNCILLPQQRVFLVHLVLLVFLLGRCAQLTSCTPLVL
jgi:hypothetical protein